MPDNTTNKSDSLKTNIPDGLTELHKKLADWVTDYKDCVERHALAETPEESADYLITLVSPLIAKLEAGNKAKDKEIDDEIDKLITNFWKKYQGKGLSPNEIMELHRSEFFESITTAQRDLTARLVREETLREVVLKLTKIFESKDSVELENYIQDLRNEAKLSQGVMP